jgi:hypothetical protein
MAFRAGPLNGLVGMPGFSETLVYLLMAEEAKITPLLDEQILVPRGM